MASDHYTRFILLVACGFGLLLVGGINLFLPRVPRFVRLGIGCLSVAVAFGIASLVAEQPAVAAQASGLTALVVATTFGLGSSRFRSAAAAVATFAASARARWGTLTVVGLALIFGSVAAYESADESAIDRHMAELNFVPELPPLRVANRAAANTDRGTAVVLQEPDDSREPVGTDTMEERFFSSSPHRFLVIRQQAASASSNCHGWVFTGGQFWIGGAQVDAILNDNGYFPITTPTPSDLAVYRSATGVVHTAIVRYVSEGSPVMVEGKWGAQGVYLHAVEHSCYGSDVTFYRSNRKGHVLAGLGHSGSPRPVDELLTE